MIRRARPTDQPAFTALFRELGIDRPSPDPDRCASALVRGTLVDERDGHVEGYVRVETLGAIGYVRDLVVAERGRGAELMLAAAAALRAAGVREWHLNVKADDAAAIGLYETLGLREEHRSAAVRVPWSAVDTLPHEPVTALPVTAAEDDDLERALGMLGGQIAMVRGREVPEAISRAVAPVHRPHVLRQLRDAGCAAVGFAAFDPEVPGARIFQVTRPTLAGPLLAALRPHARHDGLAVVIEDHAALADLLIAHGGVIRLQLRHYRGPIPGSEDR